MTLHVLHAEQDANERHEDPVNLVKQDLLRCLTRFTASEWAGARRAAFPACAHFGLGSFKNGTDGKWPQSEY